jgi:hypothetical protein
VPTCASEGELEVVPWAVPSAPGAMGLVVSVLWGDRDDPLVQHAAFVAAGSPGTVVIGTGPESEAAVAEVAAAAEGS